MSAAASHVVETLGVWSGATAAGLKELANPQFVLRCVADARVTLLVERTDAGAKSMTGLFVTHGDGEHRRVEPLKNDQVAASYSASHRARLEFDAAAGEAYVVLAYLRDAGLAGTFRLSATHSLPNEDDCQLTELPAFFDHALESEWRPPFSGGTKKTNNPQFFVRIRRPSARLLLRLRRAADDAAYMCLMSPVNGDRPTRRVEYKDVVVESSLAKTSSLSLGCTVEPGSYVLLCTRSTVDATEPFSLTLLTDDAEASITPLPPVEPLERISCEDIIDACRSEPGSVLLLRDPVPEIAARCAAANATFVDADFPPEAKSHNTTGLRRSGDPVPPVDWTRCAELSDDPRLYVDGVSPDDMRQGYLGNCWWCEAVAAVAQRPAVIEALFERDHLLPCGACSVRFHHRGRWYYIVVDDYLPTRRGRRCFAHSSDDRENWVCLLEKAHAKFYGSYSSLNGGHPDVVAFDSLTGGEVAYWSFGRHDQTEVWARLMQYVGKGWILGASSRDSVSDEPAVSANGIVRGHGYSILDAQEFDDGALRLVQLRNTWGRTEWRGPWSDKSELWAQRADVARALEHRDVDDGRFWMTLNDFFNEFAGLHSCRLKDDAFPFECAIRSSFIEGHGGLDSADNPQLELTLTEETRLRLHLHNYDQVGVPMKFLIAHSEREGARIDKVVRNKLLARTVLNGRRILQMEPEPLGPGTYVVILCLQRQLQSAFQFTVHATSPFRLRLLPFDDA